MAKAPNSRRWSLPVPSVQELASQHLHTVPPRYVRDDFSDIITVPSGDHQLRLPLIDMTKMVNPETQAVELHKLHSSCKEWGIFQLINHGVSDESLRNMRKQFEEFFELPLQEKKHLAQRPGSNEGYGHLFVMSEEQKLEWQDMLFIKVLPFQSKILESWPVNPYKFREILVNYVEEMRKVTVSILKFIAMALEIKDEDFYESYNKEGKYDMRVNFYPACPEPEKVIGIHPHVDVHGITLLQECSDTSGLQVLKDGHWVFVEPIDGALTVDIGLILEMMSNGIYKAPFHRAVVNKSKERLAIVTICCPSSSCRIGPAKQLLQSGSPPLYKSLTLEEYFECFYNSPPGSDIPFIDKLKI